MSAKKSYVKWVIGAGVIGVAIAALSSLNFGENVVFFYTPKEITANAAELSAKTIKVGAMVKPGSVDWNAEDLSLNFTLTDLKGTEIAVQHKGTPPDMFKENQGVVVEGKVNPEGDMIASKRLMVKHSEEYKKPGDHSTMNEMLLEKSIFKNEQEVNEANEVDNAPSSY